MNTFEIIKEERKGKDLVDLQFSVITENEEVYLVKYYSIDNWVKEYGYNLDESSNDNFCVRVYKSNCMEMSNDTEIAKGYLDSSLSSMAGDELNVEDNEELTNDIMNKIAERIRVAYIEDCTSKNGLSEIALNGYRYNINHVYNFKLDEVADDETIIEAYLLDDESMCVSEYDFSKNDLLSANRIAFYESKEI